MINKFKGEFHWLSNFYPVPVVLDGMTFESVEHAYVAAKTLDQQAREKIRRLPNAAAAKKLGRRIGRTIQLRPAWNDNFRTEVMRGLLKQKFQSLPLRQKLIDTGDEILIEGNHWHDNWFGCCRCSKCGGQGRNILGVLLMEIRAECRSQDASSGVAENWRLAHAA
jgi:ribA/ribD-fused uncharacterized protein